MRGHYNGNLERGRPNQKLAGIPAITTQQILEDGDEVNKVLGRVFEARNKAAHPKMKTQDANKPVKVDDPTIETARQSVADMKRFLELFRGLVPWEFHATLVTGKRKNRRRSMTGRDVDAEVRRW